MKEQLFRRRWVRVMIASIKTELRSIDASSNQWRDELVNSSRITTVIPYVALELESHFGFVPYFKEKENFTPHYKRVGIKIPCSPEEWDQESKRVVSPERLKAELKALVLDINHLCYYWFSICEYGDVPGDCQNLRSRGLVRFLFSILCPTDREQIQRLKMPKSTEQFYNKIIKGEDNVGR